MAEGPASRTGSDDDTGDLTKDALPPGADPGATLSDTPLASLQEMSATIEGPMPAELREGDGDRSSADGADAPTIMDLGPAAKEAVAIARRRGSSTPKNPKGRRASSNSKDKKQDEDTAPDGALSPPKAAGEKAEAEAATPVSSSLPTELPGAAEQPTDLPTERPTRPSEESLFGGLLKEAANLKPAEKATAEATKEQDTPSAASLRVTVPAAPKRKPTPRRAAKRKAQETLQIDGRGKKRPSAISKGPERVEEEQRQLGRYKVLGEIGVGGMAIVYKAVQPALDRLVAIKELRPEYLNDEQILARFEREATSLATFQHQNIVHIYDFVRDFDAAYIVMEYVDGVDVFDVLAETTALPADVAAVIALQMATGLEYAHFRGIIHRDIKPSNILLSKLGEVKIMDFGIARDPGRANITQVGMALGTPAYMAPEQIRGEEIDFRADIFSFGICLYEMLTGEKPWSDDGSTNVARKILYEDPIPARRYNPDVPPPLEAVIERCIERDRDKRYATTAELRRDLEAYVFRQVPEEPRQRLVVFLRNRHLITEGDASAVVPRPVLSDPILRRRDLGARMPPAEDLLKPVLVAGAITFLAVLVSAILASFVPYGTRLADAPPELTPVTAPQSDE